MRPLIHRGIRTPRANHIGEAVFAEKWKLLMAHEVEHGPWDDLNRTKPMLEVVLRDYPFKITQRAATVAATWIGWLGCNNGFSILGECSTSHTQSTGRGVA